MCMFSPPRMPRPEPLPAPPQPTPPPAPAKQAAVPAQSREAVAAGRDERRRIAAAAGPANTILTSPRGTTGTTIKKTILGG